jgi:hypothetical protein
MYAHAFLRMQVWSFSALMENIAIGIANGISNGYVLLGNFGLGNSRFPLLCCHLCMSRLVDASAQAHLLGLDAMEARKHACRVPCYIHRAALGGRGESLF